MSKKPYYLTTAIAYTSGKPHIGNTYEIVLADAIVRYKRFQGYRRAKHARLIPTCLYPLIANLFFFNYRKPNRLASNTFLQTEALSYFHPLNNGRFTL